MKLIIKIYNNFLILLVLSIISSVFSNNNNVLLSEEEIVYEIKEDNESELRKAVEKLNENGGTIIIDTPIININKDSAIELKGALKGGIIGLKQLNDEYPRINFKNVRDSFDDHSISQGMITITGSNKFLKYLIIENSACYGLIFFSLLLRENALIL